MWGLERGVLARRASEVVRSPIPQMCGWKDDFSQTASMTQNTHADPLDGIGCVSLIGIHVSELL